MKHLSLSYQKPSLKEERAQVLRGLTGLIGVHSLK